MAGEYRDLVYEHAGVKRAEMQREIGEALAFFADVIRGPVTDEIPPLTPDGWGLMRCRIDSRVPSSEVDMLTAAECCRCPWCRWNARNAPIVANWRLSQEHRPHRIHTHPFGSVGAALASLRRPDGASLRSQLGSLVSRCREVDSLGTAIQTTRRHDRDPVEVRRADLGVDVERSVWWACSSEDVRGGIATGAAVLLVALSVSDAFHPEPLGEPLGISVAAVRGVVSRARKRITVDLAARGLVPEPRDRAKLAGEIEKRRADLVG